MKFPPIAQISPRTSAGNAAELMLNDLDRLAEIVCGMPKEPFGEWMRQKGYPPEKWVTVIPEKMRTYGGQKALPNYVRFSHHIDSPVFIRREAL